MKRKNKTPAPSIAEMQRAMDVFLDNNLVVLSAYARESYRKHRRGCVGVEFGATGFATRYLGQGPLTDAEIVERLSLYDPHKELLIAMRWWESDMVYVRVTNLAGEETITIQ
jgi:hypothetical protein